MRRSAFLLVVTSCGSSTSDDAAVDALALEDATSSDGTVDGSAKPIEAGSEAGNLCMVPNKVCSNPCPMGTFCLRTVGKSLQANDLGCTPIPSSCPNGIPTCDCMKHFCTAANETCTEFYNVPLSGLVCERSD